MNESDHMTFKWLGRSYDTAKMEVFETENPAAPVVYVGPGGEVFIVEIERLEGIEVRRVGHDEAIALAERHGFSHLLNPKVQPAHATSSATSKQHALIVEDDGSSRYALGRLLNRSGYEVVVAATIAEAEMKLKELPKWMILDLRLPDGRGTTLLERVRAEHLPIKVAITTGETDEKLLLEICDLQPDVIFRKPLELSKIIHWLDAA